LDDQNIYFNSLTTVCAANFRKRLVLVGTAFISTGNINGPSGSRKLFTRKELRK